MKIITTAVTVHELKTLAANRFGHMVKAVVDVRRGILAVDAELHADLETALLEDGSRQEDLWGINLYPELSGEEWVEFDSMINVRPSQGNKSRGVDDARIRAQIVAMVSQKVKP